MTIIFTGKTEQYSFENNKLYKQTRFNEGANFGVKQELAIPAQISPIQSNDGSWYELAMIIQLGNLSCYRRHVNQGQWDYEHIVNLGNANQAWAPAPANYHPENQFSNITTQEFQQIAHWRETRNTAFQLNLNQIPSPLSTAQKQRIQALILPPTTGELASLKASCDSSEQYKNCLFHLLQNQNKPANLNSNASAALDTLKTLLSVQGLHQLALNGIYNGHLATINEAYNHMGNILVLALKGVDPTYNTPLTPLAGNQGNALCWPGEDPVLLQDQNRNPLYQLPISDATQNKAKPLLEDIVAIQKPGKPEINDNPPPSSEQLQKAIKAINQINAVPNNSELGQYLYPFLQAMAHQVQNNLGSLTYLRENFLTPLYNEAKTALETNNQTTRLNAPTPQQFITRYVDEWNGVRRYATHQDFVKFQFENPQAILLIPDNFTDAELPENQRHMRQGRAGLAGPMAPQNVSQTQQPVYDICTFGIPTGNAPANLSEQQQKDEVQNYFAKLYGELRHGRTIAVPRTREHGVDEWAFGGGTFDHSNLTRFIQSEFDKLQQFCNGQIALNTLDQKYQNAWNNPPISLPFPALQAPQEEVIPPAPQPAPAPTPPEGIQADRNLTNPGFRVKLEQWLQRNRHGQLEEKQGALHATLSNGVDMVVYKDKILATKSDGGELSDAELRESITQIINAYKHAHAPGNPPPLKPLGNEKQKEIIRELITNAGVPLATETNAATQQNADQNVNPPRPGV